MRKYHLTSGLWTYRTKWTAVKRRVMRKFGDTADWTLWTEVGFKDRLTPSTGMNELKVLS